MTYQVVCCASRRSATWTWGSSRSRRRRTRWRSKRAALPSDRAKRSPSPLARETVTSSLGNLRHLILKSPVLNLLMALLSELCGRCHHSATIEHEQCWEEIAQIGKERLCPIFANKPKGNEKIINASIWKSKFYAKNVRRRFRINITKKNEWYGAVCGLNESWM